MDKGQFLQDAEKFLRELHILYTDQVLDSFATWFDAYPDEAIDYIKTYVPEQQEQ